MRNVPLCMASRLMWRIMISLLSGSDILDWNTIFARTIFQGSKIPQSKAFSEAHIACSMPKILPTDLSSSSKREV